ncbi:hypothetical protein L7F22_039961, partial [Adiantum nelumboides]|nr:hypothetical protein [Adiantum nelumboides]
SNSTSMGLIPPLTTAIGSTLPSFSKSIAPHLKSDAVLAIYVSSLCGAFVYLGAYTNQEQSHPPFLPSNILGNSINHYAQMYYGYGNRALNVDKGGEYANHSYIYEMQGDFRDESPEFEAFPKGNLDMHEKGHFEGPEDVVGCCCSYHRVGGLL